MVRQDYQANGHGNKASPDDGTRHARSLTLPSPRGRGDGESRREFHAKLAVPFGVLGIRTDGAFLSGIEFLPGNMVPVPPRNELAVEICRQLLAYLADAGFVFDLPLRLSGTAHQRKVWQALCAIPAGQTASYGEVARRIGSAPRAVGQACGANPVPIVVPCHRVVARHGLGGFMNSGAGAALEIKQWLLRHECR